jgi:hypothetical protein
MQAGAGISKNQREVERQTAGAKAMNTKTMWLAGITLCIGMSPSLAAGQSLPQPLREWKVVSSVSGGIAGKISSLTVNSDGKFTVLDTQLGYSFDGKVAGELLTRFTVALKSAQMAKLHSDGPVIPDGFSSSLQVTTGGHDYLIEPSAEFAVLLREAFDRSVQQAVTGTWWESAWKLCKPTAQLSASQLDPAIETLVFNLDGTFAVTWPGGGAHTTGIPHIFIPDYRGHYKVVPSSGVISMQMDAGGIFVPQDFAGKGYFRLDGKQLILRNVWFGTKQVKQKPDICELTFSRK